MPLTRFPYGVSSMGVPIMPGPMIVPNLINSATPPSGCPAGYTGVTFVDGTNGSDANDGLGPSTALKTYDTALNRCVGGYNEIVYLLGGSTAITYSTGNSWSPTSGSAGYKLTKNYIHTIGLSSPLRLGQRARLTGGASTNLFTPLLEVNGLGNSFWNMEFQQDGNHATQAAVCLAVTGLRNTFVNCTIQAGIGALAAGNAAMRSLMLGGITGGTGTTSAGESYFKNCYIGDDTIARTSTQSEIEILTGTPRVVFEDCILSSYTSAGNNLFLTVGASGIDRFLLFRNCVFSNPSTFSGGVDMSNAMALNAACGGRIILNNCALTGVTATAATKTCLYFDNVNGSTTTGKDIVAGW